MSGTLSATNGEALASIVAEALCSMQGEAPLHTQMSRIRRHAELGRETPADRRRYCSLALLLLLRRSACSRAHVPEELASAAHHWHHLREEVEQLRVQADVDAALGSDDAPLPR